MPDFAALNSLLVAASEAGHESEPAIAPWAVGAIALGLLLVLLFVLLAFGKGREHT
ncbi:MAG TPA: hypothetical protein VNZ66_00585 [Aeromicrobium sp.]|nr:hypothetical protein [Aeromicrobium sp.]